MWNCIKSQIDGDTDISLSAGNTGVLLVISRMILKMMSQLSKPVSRTWPNKNGMNVVSILEPTLNGMRKISEFELGSVLYKSLYPNYKPLVSLLMWV